MYFPDQDYISREVHALVRAREEEDEIEEEGSLCGSFSEPRPSVSGSVSALAADGTSEQGENNQAGGIEIRIESADGEGEAAAAADVDRVAKARAEKEKERKRAKEKEQERIRDRGKQTLPPTVPELLTTIFWDGPMFCRHLTVEPMS